MVAEELPEWLPPGFTVKSKRNNDGKKRKYYFNVAMGKKYYSKKKVIQCATKDDSLLVTPQMKNGDDKGSSSISKVNAVSDNTNDSAEWLPNGWTVEQRKSMSGKAYKIYTDVSSGRKFYSKVAVTRHLSSDDHAGTISKQNKIDNEDQPLLDISSNILPDTSTGNIRGKKRKANSLAKIENVDEPVQEKSLQIISMADAGCVPSQQSKGDFLTMIDIVGEPLTDIPPQVISTTKTDVRGKKRRNSFKTVSVARTTPDDLPLGWVKEVRTCKRGKDRRKDPFYMDPVSGYAFCSKPDAMRYLETNDIRKCKKTPQKWDLEGIMLNENKIPSSNLANEKLSMHEKQPFSGEEPDVGVESSGTKSPAEQETMILKPKQANHKGIQIFEESFSRETSNKDAEMGKTSKSESKSRNKRGSTKPKKKKGNIPESESEPSIHGTRVVDVDVAIGSAVIDPLTQQQYPESGGGNKRGSRKPKKETGSSLPLRTSKRLARSVAEIQSNLELEERPQRATVRRSIGIKVDKSPSFPLEASDSIPRTSYIEPVKEAVDHTVITKKTCQDAIQLKVVEKPPTESSAVLEEPSCDVATGSPIINPSTQLHYPESGCRKKRGSRKPKIETGSSLPVRTSKRLAHSVPEMQSKLELKERPIRAVRRSIGSKVDKSPSFPLEASDSIPQTSNIKPVKEAVDHVAIEETCQDFIQLKEVEKPPTESSAVPEDQRPQQSEFSYDFGDSWSCPLEIASKTLQGEIAIEKTPTCGAEKLDTTCLTESPSVAPVNFQSKLASKSNSLKKSNAVDPLPASSPSVSAIRNTASSPFSGFNYQPNSVSSKKHNTVDLFPAISPSISATETTGSSTFSTFSYQPNSESSEKHDAIDLLPARSPLASVLGSATFSSFSSFDYEQKSESLKAQNAVDLLPASSPSVSAIIGTTGFNYQPNSASSKKHTAVDPFPASSPWVSPIGTTSVSSFGGFNYQPNSESSKKHHAVDPLPASSPSVSAIEISSFSSSSGFNYLPNSEYSKKHNAIDPSPVCSPSVSAIGTTGFSSFSSFNYQPKSESSKKHNAVDLSPARSPPVAAIGTAGFSSFSSFNYQPNSESSKKHNAFSAIGTTGFSYQPNPESSGKQNARSPSVSALGATIFGSFRGSNYQPNSESSGDHNAFDMLPARSPSVSVFGSTGFSSFRGFNYQPVSEASEKHNAADLFPVSSPSVSATGRMGFSSFRDFNYQPKSNSSQKHNAFDLLPASSPSAPDLGNTGFGSFSNLNYQPKHESSKRHNFVDPQASGIGDTGFSSFSSFNYQPKHESSKTHHVIDLFPASSPSESALGNPGDSSFRSFNYQPISESSKRHSSVDPYPANPPSSSSLGDLGLGSYSGFNYQPSNKFGKKASQSKFNP